MNTQPDASTGLIWRGTVRDLFDLVGRAWFPPPWFGWWVDRLPGGAYRIKGPGRQAPRGCERETFVVIGGESMSIDGVGGRQMVYRTK